jgi:hypothetical protein
MRRITAVHCCFKRVSFSARQGDGRLQPIVRCIDLAIADLGQSQAPVALLPMRLPFGIPALLVDVPVLPFGIPALLVGAPASLALHSTTVNFRSYPTNGAKSWCYGVVLLTKGQGSALVLEYRLVLHH